MVDLRNLWTSSPISEAESHLPKMISTCDWRRLGQLLSFIRKSDQSNKIKRSFLPSNGCVNTAVWMHQMDAEAYVEKVCLQLHKNAVNFIELVLKAASHNAAAVRTLNTHLENHPRYAEHYWRSIDELISDVLLWTPSYRRARVG